LREFNEDKKAIGDKIINWFNEFGRQLPWRETTNPYYILVSEIMLQQTQVATVIPYYLRFIDSLPTLEALAHASEDELHKLWEGLGYYSRVRRLQQLAIIVIKSYQSKIPDNKENLIKLPGIGPYTCGAVLSFAFHQKEAAVDGNVKRVLARLLADNADIIKQTTTKRLTQVLEDILPDEIYPFNQGLIELGALICKPKNPECERCPVNEYCKALAQGKVDQLPVKAKKAKPKVMNVPIIIIENQGNILFIKRSSSGLLSNQWGLPIIEKDIEKKLLESEIVSYLSEEFGITDQVKLKFLGHVKHAFSHIIWEQDIYVATSDTLIEQINLVEQPVTLWTKVENIAVPTAFKKSVEVYLEQRGYASFRYGLFSEGKNP